MNKGRSSAKQCRVLVHEFYIQRSDGSKYIKKPILPRHIHWPTEEPQDLIPTVPYYLTIAEIRDDEQMGSSGEGGPTRTTNSKLFLRIESSGAKGSFHEVGKGTVVLPIRVFAENARGNEIVYIEVFWNGEIISDRSQESFGCRRLSKSEVETVVGGAQ